MKEKNPVIEFSIKEFKLGTESVDVLGKYLESGLNTSGATNKTIQNRICETYKTLKIAENMAIFDSTRASKLLEKAENANGLELKLRTYDPLTKEEVMDREGLDPLLWECVKFKTRQSLNALNPWYISEGNFSLIENFNAEVLVERFNSLLSGYKPVNMKLPSLPIGNYMLEIDPPDAHIGMMNDGNSETIKNQCDRYKKSVMSMLTKAEGHNLDEIVYIVGSDLIHINADKPETKKGTPQEINGHYDEIIREVVSMVLDIVYTLANNARKIKVIVVPGNHDEQHCAWIGLLLDKVFSLAENVTIDSGIDLRKYHKFGKTAFCFIHKLGKAQNDLNVKMFHEMKDLGLLTEDVQYYEIHGGHMHQPSAVVLPSFTTNQKITQRILSSLCSSARYSKNAYGEKVMEAQGFLYSRHNGVEEIYTYRADK